MPVDADHLTGRWITPFITFGSHQLKDNATGDQDNQEENQLFHGTPDVEQTAALRPISPIFQKHYNLRFNI